MRRILDLGTGTGALLLAALAEFPSAWGLGIDLVPAAAALAAAQRARAPASRSSDVPGGTLGCGDRGAIRPHSGQSALYPIRRDRQADARSGGARAARRTRRRAGRAGRLPRDPPGTGPRCWRRRAWRCWNSAPARRTRSRALAREAGLAEMALRSDLGGVARALVAADRGRLKKPFGSAGPRGLAFAGAAGIARRAGRSRTPPSDRVGGAGRMPAAGTDGGGAARKPTERNGPAAGCGGGTCGVPRLVRGPRAAAARPDPPGGAPGFSNRKAYWHTHEHETYART